MFSIVLVGLVTVFLLTLCLVTETDCLSFSCVLRIWPSFVPRCDCSLLMNDRHREIILSLRAWISENQASYRPRVEDL